MVHTDKVLRSSPSLVIIFQVCLLRNFAPGLNYLGVLWIAEAGGVDLVGGTELGQTCRWCVHEDLSGLTVINLGMNTNALSDWSLLG